MPRGPFPSQRLDEEELLLEETELLLLEETELLLEETELLLLLLEGVELLLLLLEETDDDELLEDDEHGIQASHCSGGQNCGLARDSFESFRSKFSSGAQ